MSLSPERLWNRSFILCVCNNFFLFVYYFALLTILPIYIMKDLGGSVKEAGLALTLLLASSIAVRPFSSMIIEKLGKKISMRGAGVIFALFAFGYLLMDSLWSLLLVRFLHGIWFSILTTMAVPVANEFIPEQRFEECTNIEGTDKLSFDLFIPEYNLLIEYDGIQHRQPIKYFGGEKSFFKTKENDEQKNKFIKNKI